MPAKPTAAQRAEQNAVVTEILRQASRRWKEQGHYALPVGRPERAGDRRRKAV